MYSSCMFPVVEATSSLLVHSMATGRSTRAEHPETERLGR